MGHTFDVVRKRAYGIECYSCGEYLDLILYSF
jgi:hypothetical protein